MPPPTFGSMRSRFSLRFFSWARRKQKRPAFYFCLEDNLSPGALQALKDPLVRDGLSYSHRQRLGVGISVPRDGIQDKDEAPPVFLDTD